MKVRVVVAAGLLAACQSDRPLAPSLPTTPTEAAARDGSGASGSVTFLAPLTNDAPPASYDATLLGSLSVVVCKVNGASCATVLTVSSSSAGSEQLKLSTDGVYQTTINTGKTKLSGAHRIRVLAGGNELGAINVTLTNAALPIKFKVSGSTAKIVSNIDLAAATGTFGGATTLEAVLSPATPVAVSVANETINFTVNGVAAGSAVTDANGIARVTYNVQLPAGSYDVTASLAPSQVFAPFSRTGTLTVSAAAIELTMGVAIGFAEQPTTITAHLAPAVAGKTVSFAVGFKTASGTTDANGNASAQVVLSAGIYTATASFATDGFYVAANAGSTVIVNRIAPSIVIDPATGLAGRPITVSARYTPAIAGVIVTFDFDGKASTTTATTDASGIAQVTVVFSAAGTYSVTATTEQSATYESSSNSSTIIVAPGTVTLTLDIPSLAVMGSQVDLHATALPDMEGQQVEWHIKNPAGVEFGGSSVVSAGVASFAFVFNQVGTWTVEARFLGTSGILPASSGIGAVTVIQAQGGMKKPPA